MANFAMFEAELKNLEARNAGTPGLAVVRPEIEAERKKQVNKVSALGNEAWDATQRSRASVDDILHKAALKAARSDLSGRVVFAKVQPGTYVLYGNPAKGLWYWRRQIDADGSALATFDQTDQIPLNDEQGGIPMAP